MKEKNIEALQHELAFTKQELSTVLDITNAVNSNRTSAELLKIFSYIFRAQLGIEKMCFMIPEGGSWKVILHYGIQTPTPKVEGFMNERQQKKQNLKTGLGEFCTHSGEMQNGNVLEVIIGRGVKAYVVFDAKDNSPEKVERSRVFIETISKILLVALENRNLIDGQIRNEALRREVELAGEIQKKLFPKELPDNSFLKVEALNIPHAQVGGDFYNVLALNGGEYLFVIADVSGKGIPAALLMSNVQAVLGSTAILGWSLTDILKNLNYTLYKNSAEEKYVTLFIAKYSASSRTLEYINAGHPPPFCIFKNNISELGEGTTIIGMFEKIDAPSAKVQIPSDSRLFMFTDGLSEAENEKGEMFGTDKIKTILQDYRKNDGKNSVVKFIVSELNQFCGKRAYTDDVTLLSVHFL